MSGAREMPQWVGWRGGGGPVGGSLLGQGTIWEVKEERQQCSWHEHRRGLFVV